MRPFLRNNIAFRRFTAERYAAFYKAKAFMLGQVLDSDRHEFTSQARETLLQYYSIATDWLEEIERDFIRRGRGITTKEETEAYIDRFADMERSMHSLLRENPEVFSAEFSDTWIDMRERLIPYISNVFQQQLSPSMEESFRRIAEFTIGYMNYTMFHLHEIDYIVVKRKEPFIYVDKMDVSIMEASQVHAPKLRTDVYREHGLLKDYSNPLRAKLYVDERWTEHSEKRRLSLKSVRDGLSGFKICFC